MLSAVALAGMVAILVSGCAMETPGTPAFTAVTGTAAAASVVSVPDALAGANPGATAAVRGKLIVELDGVPRLCSGSAESMPPSCAEPWIELVVADTQALEGLTEVDDVVFGSVVAQIRWADSSTAELLAFEPK